MPSVNVSTEASEMISTWAKRKEVTRDEVADLMVRAADGRWGALRKYGKSEKGKATAAKAAKAAKKAKAAKPKKEAKPKAKAAKKASPRKPAKKEADGAQTTASPAAALQGGSEATTH